MCVLWACGSTENSAGNDGLAGSGDAGASSGASSGEGASNSGGTSSGSGSSGSGGTASAGGDGASPVQDAGSEDVGSPAKEGGAAEAGEGGTTCAQWLGGAGATSQWAHVAGGHLAYQTLPHGDRILDFSYAGYMGGGVALPLVPQERTLSPAGGTTDDTAAIQAAIDAVSALPLAGGFRGAVVLAAGTFHVSATLTIAASGVVLRGAGSGTSGSSLAMTSATPFTAIQVEGSGSYGTTGSAVSITDAYVPAGALSFGVGDASGFAVGDTVLVRRPVTAAWVAFMGMDHLVDSAGQAQTWIGVGSTINTDRTIASISGNTITLDAPLSDSFDATVLSPPGGSLVKYTFAGRISQVGVEHLRIVGPPVNIPISMPQYSAVLMNDAADAWLNDVFVQDTQGSFTVDGRAKRVTLDRVSVSHTVPHTGDGMADFSISGTQTLVNQCASNGSGSWPILTQGEQTGPIAVLHFTSDQPSGISPHQRWATGLLADNCQFPNSPKGTPGVAFWDRGTHGSGQGWTIGGGVAWNLSSPYLLVQQPPGSQNWCIGCQGSVVVQAPAGSKTTPPNGVFDSLGAQVSPGSLYLAQLCDRLGPQAVANIGY